MIGQKTIHTKITDIEKDFDLDKLELNLKTSNIFRILRVIKTEIRHSNFIAWLLDPSESHNLNEVFLRRFLLDLDIDIDDIKYKKVEIRREWRNIDLLIIIDKSVICIENKVESKEHSNQLKRYKEIIYDNFETYDKNFVYLTPFGLDASDEDYQAYSYYQIVENIKHIEEVYRRNLTAEVVQYLNDYSEILKIEIMKDHEVNSLALKIYNRHKEAFDFIFENKPDFTSEFKQKIEAQFPEFDWVLGSSTTKFIRFQTSKLVEILPKTEGWTQKESFLFELLLDGKQIIFKATVAQGNGSEEHERIRNILSTRLLQVKNAKSPNGKKWLVYFIEKYKFDFDKMQEKTDDEINDDITRQLNKIKVIVDSVEEALLKSKDELLEYM